MPNTALSAVGPFQPLHKPLIRARLVQQVTSKKTCPQRASPASLCLSDPYCTLRTERFPMCWIPTWGSLAYRCTPERNRGKNGSRLLRASPSDIRSYVIPFPYPPPSFLRWLTEFNRHATTESQQTPIAILPTACMRPMPGALAMPDMNESARRLADPQNSDSTKHHALTRK